MTPAHRNHRRARLRRSPDSAEVRHELRQLDHTARAFIDAGASVSVDPVFWERAAREAVEREGRKS